MAPFWIPRSISTFLKSQKAFLLALDPLRQISVDLNKAKDNNNINNNKNSNIINFELDSLPVNMLLYHFFVIIFFVFVQFFVDVHIHIISIFIHFDLMTTLSRISIFVINYEPFYRNALWLNC